MGVGIFPNAFFIYSEMVMGFFLTFVYMAFSFKLTLFQVLKYHLKYTFNKLLRFKTFVLNILESLLHDSDYNIACHLFSMQNVNFGCKLLKISAMS